jgi:hypothetical protein
MAVTRRQFMKVSAAGLAASSIGALGFTGAGDALAAGVRPFKLERATETRNACPYCAVACGVLIYSLGDKSKNAKSSIIHVEGDPDHPVNRGLIFPYHLARSSTSGRWTGGGRPASRGRLRKERGHIRSRSPRKYSREKPACDEPAQPIADRRSGKPLSLNAKSRSRKACQGPPQGWPELPG